MRHGSSCKGRGRCRGELVNNHIDARHILPGDSAEVVPSALTQACVAALVLDYMANVHNAALAAPVTNLLVKARTVELRGDVHVGVADPSAGGVARPKLVELTQPIRAQCLVQASRKFVRPWQCHVIASDKAAGRSVFEGRTFLVHKARLIGKEAQNGLAELVAQMLKRGFVDGVDEHTARIGVDHVGVFIAKAGLLAGDVELEGGNAGGRECCPRSAQRRAQGRAARRQRQNPPRPQSAPWDP